MTLIFFSVPRWKACDGGIEDGRGHAFVFRQQIVGEFVEIADAADARRPGDDLIESASRSSAGHVLGVALDEAIGGVARAKPCLRGPYLEKLSRPTT